MVSERTICRRLVCAAILIACGFGITAIIVADPSAKAESVLAVIALVSIQLGAIVGAVPGD